MTVVTCAPNHPSGVVYPGYRNRLLQTEVANGVRVIRVWTLLVPNQGTIRRSLSYMSYLISVTLLMWRLPRADVIVSTSPQFFCGLAGFVARVFKRAPWILEIRDLWPESIIAVGALRDGVVVRALEWLEGFAYRRADAIVTVSRAFVPHIATLSHDPLKISVLKNGVDRTVFDPDKPGNDIRAELGLSGRFVAAYIGTLGLAHGVGTILEAAEQLRADHRIAFLIVGDGAERTELEAECTRRKLDNVLILGQRPHTDMPDIWRACDAALVLLRRRDAFKKVLPSKMFEAMAMRRPIILGVEGHAQAMLDRAGAGIAIKPENADDLADAVRRLADDRALAKRYGEQGYAHARENHDRERLAQQYLGLLRTISSKKRADDARLDR